MGKRRRGLFQQDTGDHPPPLDEFFRELHRTDHERVPDRWVFLGNTPIEEIRANQRSYGRALIVCAILVPTLTFGFGYSTERGVSDGTRIGVAAMSVACAALGYAFLRAGRRRRQRRNPK